MNIQQLRYVVAIANSGTFREAAEKMYVSQPSLSISVRDLEKELGFKIFRRTSSGTFLTRRGMEFYEKAQELVKGFDIFQNQYANPEEEKDSVVYLYTKKKRQYIEQPYAGIWEVNPDIANRIEEIFSSWFIGKKKMLEAFLVSYFKR